MYEEKPETELIKKIEWLTAKKNEESKKLKKNITNFEQEFILNLN